MKKTFIKQRRFLISFLIVFVPLMFISIYKIDYSLTAPGFNDDISSFIIIEDSVWTGSSFHTTSVIALDGITITQYIVGTIANTVEVEEFPEFYEDIDIADLSLMSFLMKYDSLATAIVVGVENAGGTVQYNQFLTVYLTFDTLTPNSLVLGDQIFKVNGDIDTKTALDSIKCGEVAEFTIFRDDEMLTVEATKNQNDNGTCSFGVYLRYYTEITSPDINYQVIDNNTGGPSGGLMQALFIYYSIVETNLNSGLKIAGTGTIDIDGNVGAIGGIREKIITADLNDIDIFFVPHLSDDEDDNYVQALEIYNTLDTDMKLVAVSTFSEAVEYLTIYHSGDNNE